MSKGLEALEIIKNHLIELHSKNDKDPFIHLFERLPFIIIEKELKALEIIKTKWVDVLNFHTCLSLEEYNDTCTYDWQKLTQEEYELLKEVLN